MCQCKMANQKRDRTFSRGRGGLPYSQGDLNRLVDSIVHPLMKGDAKIPARIVDAELHFLIEQDIESSIKKFAKYSLPGLIVDIAKSSGSRSQRKRSKRRNRNRKA